jgi:hypothetical protein
MYDAAVTPEHVLLAPLQTPDNRAEEQGMLAGSLFPAQWMGAIALGGLRGDVATETSAVESEPAVVAPYSELRTELEGTGLQANHLNQDAAFRDLIPRDEGLANALEGNAFTDIGSPHYEFHSSLESFWAPYRKGGEFLGSRPTNAQYDSALLDALGRAGYTPSQAAIVARQAAAQRACYGLGPTDFVPRIPGRLPQKY